MSTTSVGALWIRIQFLGIILSLLLLGNVSVASECKASFINGTGTFTSPGYPAPYSGQKGVCRDIPESCSGCSSQCVWTVTVPGENSVVKLTMENVEFNNSVLCCADFIEVRDGLDSNSPLLATICNSTSPKPVMSTGNSLFVRLVSNTDRSTFGLNEVNFKALWSTACYYIKTAPSGTITSARFPPPHEGEVNCTILVKQKRGYRVTIDGTSFSWDPQNKGPCHNYLTVYDGSSDDSPVLGGPYCGTTAPVKLISTKTAVLVKFYSDSKQQNTNDIGYHLAYNRTAPECSKWELDEEKGEIKSPGFPDPFPVIGECVWHIRAPDWNYVVDLKVNEVNLGPDTNVLLDCDNERVTSELAVYDGPTDEPKYLLARYCKRNVLTHGVSSTEDEMTVVFKTKNIKSDTDWDQNTRYGFSASYSVREGEEFSDQPNERFVEPLLYGTAAEDKNMSKTSNAHVVELETGIPVGDERRKYVYIYKDGKVAFSKHSHDAMAMVESGYQKPCTQRKRGSVCAYCTTIDIKKARESGVYYHVHNKNSKYDKEVVVPVKEHIKKYRGDDDFHPSVVMVVTWDRVLQEGSKATTGGATFQVALAASEWESYAVVIYKHDSMLWEPPQSDQPIIDAGFTKFSDETPECRDVIFSRTNKIFEIDKQLGNFGKEGAWIYELGKTTSTTTAQACDDWYAKNSGRLAKRRESKMNKLPKCPCSKTRKKIVKKTWWRKSWWRWRSRSRTRISTIHIESTGMWVKSGTKRSTTGSDLYDCYRLSKSSGQKHKPYGKECCYKQNGQLIQDQPDAGTATAFNPSFSKLYEHYLREDKLAYEDCCLTSNSTEHCKKFYTLRPVGDCQPMPPIRLSFSYGDPHIKTLDEGEYTFNGWGEYTLMTLKLPRRRSFTLQARTSLAQTEDGQPIQATVFSAFGAEENGVRVFVGLDPNTNTTFIIYADGQDLSKGFRINPNFLVETEKFLIQSVDTKISILFSSGITFVVSIRLKSLALSVSVPLEYRDKTKGLLGNFNGDKTDDFILPNGTDIGQNPSEREIYNTFGPAWAVTTENSVMWYGPEEGPDNFTHPEFVPIFLDETPADIREDAEKVCGKTNMACIYDYVATGNEEFALDSKMMKEVAEETSEAIKNAFPQLDAIPTLLVTSGQKTTFTLVGKDTADDTVTYYAEFNDTDDNVRLESDTGVVTYLPDMNTSVNLRFYAMDTKQARSPSRTARVVVCSGCNGHGQCDYTTGTSPFHSFQHATCICDPAWTGEHCESQLDGCEEDPCLPGQTCTDLSPEEQGNELKGFDCGPCPKGYAYQPGYMNCMDVNECVDDSLNDCQMICSNNDGSYKCGCREGYRLNRDRKTCRDVDECQEKTARCQQLCHNTDGGYECRCEEGYVLDDSGITCQPDAAMADACKNASCSQGCKINASSGSPECFCFKGYEVDAKAPTRCVDRDECLDDICSQQCFNFKGGFSCVCHSGYTLSEDKVTCTPCKDLTYGPNCQYHCRCSGRAEACHHVTGCVCQRGWRGAQCQDDIDECTEDPNLCGTDQICVNTPGSYKCKCPDGYAKDDNGSCSDIDECSENSLLNTCVTKNVRRSQDSLYRCVNVPGTFHCKCLEGYINSGDKCVDIDECDLGISDCEQKCINMPGSYNCDCFYGFRLNVNRTACVKVADVCAEEKRLTCEHICTMSGGKAACFCRVGYTLNPDQQTCTREMNCSNAGCSHLCTTVDDKPVCSCPDSMLLDNDMKTCKNCLVGTYGKDCAYECACGLGASRCDVISGCVCKDGWTGEKCENDVNECNVTSVIEECEAKRSVCINTPGSYRCQCSKGFAFNNQSCEDIDECRDSTCEQQCENSPGSYRCLCSHGFTLEHETGACIDLDECALSATNNCTQDCVNVPGSYLCVCDRAGFKLAEDGVSCVASDDCSRTDCPTEHGGCSEEQCFCNSGYQVSDTNTCDLIDKDWCAKAECEQDCRETSDGSSFICSCGDGYLLNDDRRTCRDCPVGFYGKDCANKCSCGLGASHCDVTTGCVCPGGWTGDKCDSDVNECNVTSGQEDCGRRQAECINTPGSYEFHMNASGICREINNTECETGTYGPECSFKCACVGNNTESCDTVNGTCSCMEGWEGDTCSDDVNECSRDDISCPPNSNCSNTAGSYVCQCTDGFTKHADGSCIECETGTYGAECSFKCACVGNNTESCDTVNGTCSCMEGWEGDTCSDDVNECSRDDVSCPLNSNCSNTAGSYVCQCTDGFTKHANGSCIVSGGLARCGGTYKSPRGKIQSPNFPHNYTYKLNCVYIIEVPKKHYITLNFQAFDTEAKFDYLEIQDGGNEASPTFGRFSGEHAPFSLNTSGNQMWIRFKTDSTKNRQGFSATYVSEPSPQCGGTRMALSGVIQSPDFPNSFLSQLNCVYVITAPADYYVTLNFTTFDLQVDRDFVEIRDGGSEISPELGRFSEMSLPLTVRSTGNQMWVKFVTDDSMARSGFSATYTSGQCGGIWTSPSGTIQSPNFPNNYPNSQNCVYIIIIVPRHHHVNLTFTDFNLEPVFDYVQVRDGGNKASPILREISNMSAPLTLHSTGNQMWVNFVSDGSHSRPGFSATYTSGP